MESRVRYTAFARQLQPATCADLWLRTPARYQIEDLRHALDQHHVGQRAHHSGARPTSLATDHQALSGVLIEQVQYPRCATILRSGAHEVVAPRMVPALRPEPNAGSIVEPQTPPRRLLLRNLQPFATPDALDSILANMPVRPLQQSRDASVTVPSVLAGRFNDCLVSRSSSSTGNLTMPLIPV